MGGCYRPQKFKDLIENIRSFFIYTIVRKKIFQGLLKYLQSYKLFESNSQYTKSDILNSIGITEDEIKDICQDLIDYEYVLQFDTSFISLSGNIHREPNRSHEFYPCLNIWLKREIDSKDPRSWNGSVYYEDDENIISEIHHIIGRIGSTLENETSKVFYSIRNINDIEIRITTPSVKADSFVTSSEMTDILDQRSIWSGLNVDGHLIQAGSHVDSYIKIEPEDINGLIKSVTDGEIKDNKDSIFEGFEKIIARIKSKLVQIGCSSEKIKFYDSYNDNAVGQDITKELLKSKMIGDRIASCYTLVYGDQVVFTIELEISMIVDRDVKVKSGSLFKKSTTKHVKLYMGDMTITPNDEDDDDGWEEDEDDNWFN